MVEVLLGDGRATKKARPGKLLTTAVQRLVLLVPVREELEEEKEQQQGAEELEEREEPGASQVLPSQDASASPSSTSPSCNLR